MSSRMKLPLRFDVIVNRVEAKDCSDLSSTVNRQPTQSDQGQSLEDLHCIGARTVHIGCSLATLASSRPHRCCFGRCSATASLRLTDATTATSTMPSG